MIWSMQLVAARTLILFFTFACPTQPLLQPHGLLNVDTFSFFLLMIFNLYTTNCFHILLLYSQMNTLNVHALPYEINTDLLIPIEFHSFIITSHTNKDINKTLPENHSKPTRSAWEY